MSDLVFALTVDGPAGRTQDFVVPVAPLTCANATPGCSPVLCLASRGMCFVPRPEYIVYAGLGDAEGLPAEVMLGPHEVFVASLDGSLKLILRVDDATH